MLLEDDFVECVRWIGCFYEKIFVFVNLNKKMKDKLYNEFKKVVYFGFYKDL